LLLLSVLGEEEEGLEGGVDDVVDGWKSLYTLKRL